MMRVADWCVFLCPGCCSPSIPFVLYFPSCPNSVDFGPQTSNFRADCSPPSPQHPKILVPGVPLESLPTFATQNLGQFVVSSSSHPQFSPFPHQLEQFLGAPLKRGLMMTMLRLCLARLLRDVPHATKMTFRLRFSIRRMERSSGERRGGLRIQRRLGSFSLNYSATIALHLKMIRAWGQINLNISTMK